MKEKIRPIYSELKGYLSVAPNIETVFDSAAVDLSKQFNDSIDELNTVTDKDYNRFKITLRSIDWNQSYRNTIESLDYKTKISGLIYRLQGEYFSEEQSAQNQPSTIINASQSQFQNQSISLALDLQEKIINEISKYTEGTKERNFLEKLKLNLSTIKTAMDLLVIVLKIGGEFGLDTHTIHKLLNL